MLTLVITVFSNYNLNLTNQHQFNLEKSEEQLQITDTTIEDGSLKGVEIKNTGTTEITVRALYLKSDGQTEFIGDPSTEIHASTSKQITINPPRTLSPDFTFSVIASTERGTLSKEYFIPPWDKITLVYDTENLTIGPMRLRFESFEYSAYNSTTHQWGNWKAGWDPPISATTDVNISLAWKIRVTNIGEEKITLNNRTALSLWRVDRPNKEVAWYINASGPVQIEKGETANLFYLMNIPAQDPTNSTYWQSIPIIHPREDGFQGKSTMVFLTFFGTLTYADSTTNPFGQTIPFEAVIPQEVN
jgi:hypothetical protein